MYSGTSVPRYQAIRAGTIVGGGERGTLADVATATWVDMFRLPWGEIWPFW